MEEAAGSSETRPVEHPATTTVWRTLRTRAAVILGLAGLAITQPLLDLFGQNPEFFVAGDYTSMQIVGFALVIALLPSLVGILLTTVATLANRRVGSIVFAAAVFVLAGSFVLALLRTLDVDAIVLVVVIVALLGVAATTLVLGTRGGTLLASTMALANVVFLALFLFFSPSSELLARDRSPDDLGRVDVPPIGGPVVVVVLDEFAATTIMRADGSINEERYPGVASLAATSTWFRNASSHDNLTHRSVPSILSGALGGEDDLPTYDDRPRNLFTMLGDEVPVTRYEAVTDMCPPSICAPPPRRSLLQALDDASVVYGHRVLPSAVRDELPSIDEAWGEFGAGEDEGASDPFVSEDGGSDPSVQTVIDRAYARWRGLDADERGPLGQAQVLGRQIDAITAEPSLHFVHVALPHRPWTLSRSGLTTTYYPETIEDPGDPAYPFFTQVEYQMHATQVGAADALVGELVDHLRSLPTWDETTLVVVSDHGTNLTGANLGRMVVTDDNREEVYRIPLFVKAPGQVDGEVRDEPASTLDVVPSIVDLLGIETDWQFAGHSLFDGSEPTTESRVSSDVDAAIAIAERRAEQLPHGDDWAALAAAGEHGELVGRDVVDLDVGAPSAFRATFADADVFADLPTEDGQVPFVVSGRVETASGDEPPELLVAINGRLAGVVGGYRPAAGSWSFMGYVGPDAYRGGANEVALYEVTTDGGSEVLHLLS